MASLPCVFIKSFIGSKNLDLIIFALIRFSFIAIRKQIMLLDNEKENFKEPHKPLMKGSTKI